MRTISLRSAQRTKELLIEKENLVEQTKAATTSTTLQKQTNSKLILTTAELQKCELKLNNVVPKLEGCEAELRLLRRKCDDTEMVEQENASYANELKTVRPMMEMLDKVQIDLNKNIDDTGSHIVSNGEGLKQQPMPNKKHVWHTSWVSSPHISLLLPSLADRIRNMHNDLMMVEEQSVETSSLLRSERKVSGVEWSGVEWSGVERGAHRRLNINIETN